MSLQIPSFLYGFFRDVRLACKRKLKALERGASFADIVDSWLDVESTPGMLELDGPSGWPTAEPNFHCFALTHTLVNAWSRESSARINTLRDQWPTDSLAATWSFLGLLGQDGLISGIGSAHLPSFLERAIALWPELQAVGPRYANPVIAGAPLERVGRTIHAALALQGIPIATVNAMSAEGPAALFAASPGRRVLDHLARGDLEQAASELRAFDEGNGKPRTVSCTLADYFVMAGHAEVAVGVVRELAKASDPYNRLVTWLSNQADVHVDAQTAEDVFHACLCGGSFADWARLRRLAPADSTARVLGELELRADWPTLMRCLIHHVHDFERALHLWDTHCSSVPEIQWAAQQLADGIAERHPTRASELYLFAAERPLAIGKRHIYRASAALVAKACTVLRAAGLERDALQLVSDFRSRHRRRRLLLDAIAKQGL